MIKKDGSKYKLISRSTGKTLGTHDSRKDAIKQEYAIKISKMRKKKY